MPSGVPHIIGNEFAERFSFYGMRAILFVFMTTALKTHQGAADLMQEAEATAWVHTFITAVYFTPLLGGLLADLAWGKYRTIMLLSLVYCAGHLVLAVQPTRQGLMLGLGLIALGAGGIKPCVSAHVGDQFGATNAHLLPRIYQWFYLAINAGSALSMLLTPWLLKHYTAHVAFAVPGVLMLVATVVFWLGRHRFAHIPPDRAGFLRDLTQPRFRRRLVGLLALYVLVAAFWSIFDQTSSRWVAQAEKMDRHFLGTEILPAAMQSLNPVLVLTLIPLLTLIVYPWLSQHMRLTAMRRIGAGFVVTLGAVAVSWWIERQIDAGDQPWIAWQGLAYLLITTAEVLVSVTCLEFSYTQAPPRLKSFIMSLYLLSVALGNFFTAQLNSWILRHDPPSLAGAGYWAFFFKLLLGATALFLIVSMFYREQSSLADDPDPADAAP
ncbi:MAG: MFS transporter [Verrucomicrobiales bacterium]|nr:MFS transporter [Verrucomicrobiales bacterium]